jgi:hypothetical protein
VVRERERERERERARERDRETERPRGFKATPHRLRVLALPALQHVQAVVLGRAATHEQVGERDG